MIARIALLFLSLASSLSLAAVSPSASIEKAIGPKKNHIAYPEIPSVYAVHLPPEPPQPGLQAAGPLSPGLTDPRIEEARELKAYEDYKIISDALPRPLTAKAKRRLEAKAREAEKKDGRKAYLRVIIDGTYAFEDELKPMPALVSPRWKLVCSDPVRVEAFAYTERTLPNLVRRTPPHSRGSLLPSPYPVLIAAPGRFHEAYYWDTYFGLKGVLATGRVPLAQMVVENYLHALQQYGLVPNGMRDYYLTRSQPPFLSRMVREVYEAAPDLRWLKLRAYPLLKRDYENFWMAQRFDSASGLNFDSDDLDLPRPERHSFDDETKLGHTFRDVRAAAESGLDFTETFQGEASQIAGVLLNSVLYQYERDLEWAAHLLGRGHEEARYAEAAARRQKAMSSYLWNEKDGRFENYNLRTKQRVPVLAAFTFAPLFVGSASDAQAAAVQKNLPRLERAGGIMASELVGSAYQWDGYSGWAPEQVMAMEGLLRYHFDADAKRLAAKWVDAIASLEHRTGLMFERIDVVTRDYPVADKAKYPTQTGFLWTNSSYVWALTHVLGLKLEPLAGKAGQ